MENNEIDIKKLQSFKKELSRFMMSYKFAMDEVNTRIKIIMQEYQYTHDYNPIEHVKSRLKTLDSILNKVYRKGYELSLPSIKENIQDIAGIRIICSFISDIYELYEMLKKQDDIKIIKIKDYIKNPKPNGYKSLHLILQVPIFMSDRVEDTCVELQIRTIAMDFWASLEHKIHYKYCEKVPLKLLSELKEAADSVAHLDNKMEMIHKEIKEIKEKTNLNDNSRELLISDERFNIPYEFFSHFI